MADKVLSVLEETGQRGVAGIKSKMPLTQVALFGLLALVISFMVTFQMAPSKGVFEELSKKLTADSATALTALTAKVGTLETGITGRVSTLESGVNQKFAAYQATIDSRVSAIDGRVGGLDTKIATFDTKVASLSGLDAKINTAISEIPGKIDAKTVTMQSKIDALEKRVATLEGAQNTLINTGTVTGQGITVVYAPSNVIYSGGDYQYIVNVLNTSTIAQKIYIQTVATLGTTTGQITPNIDVVNTKFSSNTNQITGATTFTTAFSPATGLSCFRIAGTSDGYFWLGPGGVANSVPVNFALRYAAGSNIAMWNVTFSIIATP